MTETFMKWLKDEECKLEGEVTSSCVEVGKGSKGFEVIYMKRRRKERKMR